MPYTLMKGWIWVLLGVLLGIFIGWLLRSIAAKRQVNRARKHHVDAAELERLRSRLALLEPVAADRDRLRSELDRRQVELDDCRARARAATPNGAAAQGVASVRGSFQAAVKEVAADEPAPAPVALDVSRANAVLGTPIAVDDLKVVDGIGPKIESLCHGIGIVTWFDLSTTEVSLLRTMLADAGSRFRVHDPSTWPEQAALLDAGRWADFKALTDGLRGGRTTD
jgi:predicted flap endonuclease-1-like 5' DNA nuclease